MSVGCPNGHQSQTADYCDQCGARIEGAVSSSGAPSTRAGTAPEPIAAPAASPAGSGGDPVDELCPACQNPRIGEDRYCEGCGYDFTSPPPVTGPAGTASTGRPDATRVAAWEATAVADREYYDRVAPDGVTFPLHCPPRTFLLVGDQIRIGRGSSSRGIRPEVDLSGAPEDAAISHLHCILIERSDGSYSVVDPGSTNGTTLNDDLTPLTANVTVALADGDRIHLGAWTTITVAAHRSPVATAPT